MAGGVYVGGALGMELVGGYYASGYGTQNLTYPYLATAEEVLEMIGATFFLRALMIHLRDLGSVSVRLNGAPAPGSR